MGSPDEGLDDCEASICHRIHDCQKSRSMCPLVAALKITFVALASERQVRRQAEGCSAQQFIVAWPLMATPPNGNSPPSAEVRRVAFSDRGQDQIELSAWRASASDAIDSWPEWAGCTEKHRPCYTRRRTFCRANFIAVVRLASGDDNQTDESIAPSCGAWHPSAVQIGCGARVKPRLITLGGSIACKNILCIDIANRNAKQCTNSVSLAARYDKRK